VALKKYRITYKDGRTQEVEANSTRTTKEFIYFEKDGDWIHRVAADSVESFGLADIPEPELPEIEQAEFQRHPGLPRPRLLAGGPDRDLDHLLVHVDPATRSYSTFIRLATSCSGTLTGWDKARRPPEPQISTGD
jgi:hypothetical protein